MTDNGNSSSSNPSGPNNLHGERPSPLQIVGSVLAAAFGVQSSKNQERDFKHGRARNFIIAGIVFTIIFMATVFTVVRAVLSGAGVGH